jgi:hypothetical protein
MGKKQVASREREREEQVVFERSAVGSISSRL